LSGLVVMKTLRMRPSSLVDAHHVRQLAVDER
jgi:hypothetical protein